MVAPQLWKEPRRDDNGIKQFSTPTNGFIKLNFDGASKGNPGPTGIGGLFRDDQGRKRRVYVDNGGIMSNNETKLMVVCQGLKIAIRNGYNKLEVEGDSLMVIQALRKLNNGTSWDKVSRSWRTSSLIQELESILGRFDYLNIRHARREANEVADFLANWGCQELREKMDNNG